MLGELKDKSERYGVDERSRVALLGQENRSDIAAADRAQDQYNVDERTRAAILGHTMTSETAAANRALDRELAEIKRGEAVPPGEEKLLELGAADIAKSNSWLRSEEAISTTEAISQIDKIKGSEYLSKLYGRDVTWSAFINSRLSGPTRDLANQVQEVKTGQALIALESLKGSTTEREFDEVTKLEQTLIDPLSSVSAVVETLDKIQRKLKFRFEEHRRTAAETPPEWRDRFRSKKNK